MVVMIVRSGGGIMSEMVDDCGEVDCVACGGVIEDKECFIDNSDNHVHLVCFDEFQKVKRV